MRESGGGGGLEGPQHAGGDELEDVGGDMDFRRVRTKQLNSTQVCALKKLDPEIIQHDLKCSSG